MNEYDLFRAFEDVDEDILERSEVAATRRRVPTFLKWGAVAACLALVISLAGITFIAEAREYDAAVEFFEDNGLSMEGLSRSDVKAVYKDITTEHFTYDKTADVIRQAVPGVEISQEEPTPEKLAEVWSQNMVPPVETKSGISYRSGTYSTTVSGLDFKWGLPTRSYLTCFRDNEVLWRTDFTYFLLYNQVFTPYGTLVWGIDDGEYDEYDGSDGSRCSTTLILIDDSGNIKWQRWFNHGFQYGEYIKEIIDNGDGTFAVIGSGYDYADGYENYDEYTEYDKRLNSYLCLSQYDKDGNEVSFRKISEKEIRSSGLVGAWRAVRLENNYFVQVGEDKLVKLDREGRLLDSVKYDDKNFDYEICDMIEFAGQVYLSVDADLKEQEDGNAADSEESPVRKTAMLLVCDPEDSELKTFYSAKGFFVSASQQQLTVNDAGELVWEVGSELYVEYPRDTKMPEEMPEIISPEDFSNGLRGYRSARRVCQYAFDTDGNLIKEEPEWITGYFLPSGMNYFAE